MEKIKNKREIVKMLVKSELTEEEHDELFEALVDTPISVDVDKQEDETLTMGEKVADKLSEVAGSWWFIISFCIFLILWIFFNTMMSVNAVDPFPFILLNLMLSCLAALQAPIIMMSQNRQAKKDSLRNQNDYIIDLKSELILEDLHKQMETILKNQRKILKLLDEEDGNN